MRWIRVRQAAQRVQVSEKLIYSAIRSGALRASRIGTGRNVRTTEEWVDAFMQAAETATGRENRVTP
jgi:excisionase family DNA binding protein